MGEVDYAAFYEGAPVVDLDYDVAAVFEVGDPYDGAEWKCFVGRCVGVFAEALAAGGVIVMLVDAVPRRYAYLYGAFFGDVAAFGRFRYTDSTDFLTHKKATGRISNNRSILLFIIPRP